VSLFSDKYEWQNYISFPNSEVPWHDAGRQVALEGEKKKKREELGLKYRQMYWLMGRRSALTTNNRLVLYKQILKQVWTYGIQLWGCTKPSNIAIIQRFQNEVLRAIVNAPWYVRDADFHRDLKLEMVTAEIKMFARKHEERLHHHNVEAIHLLDNSELLRRLKRTKPLSWQVNATYLRNCTVNKVCQSASTLTHQAEPLGDACRKTPYQLRIEQNNLLVFRH
jgi:hypothetical protein